MHNRLMCCGRLNWMPRIMQGRVSSLDAIDDLISRVCSVHSSHDSAQLFKQIVYLGRWTMNQAVTVVGM